MDLLSWPDPRHRPGDAPARHGYIFKSHHEAPRAPRVAGDSSLSSEQGASAAARGLPRGQSVDADTPGGPSAPEGVQALRLQASPVGGFRREPDRAGPPARGFHASHDRSRMITGLVRASSALCARIVGLRSFRADRFRLPLGAINGSYLRAPPCIDDPRIGRSHGLPIALEFRIGEDSAGFPGGIGRIVHRALLPDAPDFSVHIKFACAKPDLLGRSDFANPSSIWYNVFVGYYQVEVDQEEWGRPFGYDLDADGNGTLRLEEVARLAQADWNYLSNQLYGVP